MREHSSAFILVQSQAFRSVSQGAKLLGRTLCLSLALACNAGLVSGVRAHVYSCTPWLLFVSFTVCKFHSLVGVWVTVWIGFTVLIFLITSLNSFPHLLAFFCEVCLNKSFAHFSGGLSFLLIHSFCFLFH